MKNVFLVGGFGESKFLQEELEFSLNLRDIDLRKPDTNSYSWTAVVRGAVVCGIEKDTTLNLSTAVPSPRHFGIIANEQFTRVNKHEKEDLRINPLTNMQMAQNQLLWLINKGDAIFSNEPVTVTHPLSKAFSERGSKYVKVTVYSYFDDDKRPTRLHGAADGMYFLSAHSLRSRS